MNCDCTQEFDLCVNQGATYARTFLWLVPCGCGTVGGSSQPVDLTGYTATMQIRAYALSTVVLYDASADITLGGIFGTIALVIPAADTEGFTWWTGVYDLLLTSAGGQVTRLLFGSVQVSPGVSQ